MKKKIRRTSNCSSCGVILNNENSYINQHYCKKCNNKNKIKQYSVYKQKCVAYKGGQCVYCGYNKCLSALEFHHINPEEKDFSINPRKSKTSLFTDLIKKELDKCILLCANCHREEHYKIQQLK